MTLRKISDANKKLKSKKQAIYPKVKKANEGDHYYQHERNNPMTFHVNSLRWTDNEYIHETRQCWAVAQQEEGASGTGRNLLRAVLQTMGLGSEHINK